jgi:hypothetical protein
MQDIFILTKTMAGQVNDAGIRRTAGELAMLVKLNLKTEIDNTIYGEGYNRIAEMNYRIKTIQRPIV